MSNMKKYEVAFPSDLNEATNKNILFTGAGFSKTYGGFLVNEVWGRIYNHKNASEKIKLELQKDKNYEKIFGNLSEDGKELLKEILSNIFQDMDEKIKNKVKGLQYFISPEKPNLFFDKNKYNFIFTINQDLLVERYFLHQANKNKNFMPLYYPYIDFDIYSQAVSQIYDSDNVLTIQGQDGYSFEKLTKTIKFDKTKEIKKEKVNYIKLHGSFNWHHSEGWNINVTGSRKPEQIDDTNTLLFGMKCLERVSNIENLRLYVFGYSFSDQHINKFLIDSTKKGAKLVIISVESWAVFKEHFDAKTPSCFYSAIDKYCQIISPSIDIPRIEHLMEYIIDSTNLNKCY